MTTGSPEPENVFFIVGTGRCGSTLLQSMLMCHPRIGIPPETHFFFRFDPASLFGGPVPSGREDEYVRFVCEQDWAKELGVDPSVLRDHINAGARSTREVFLAVCRTLMPGGLPPVLGEKSPRHEKNLPAIRAAFPDARIVHIVRDPRDVVLSLRKEYWAKDETIQRVARSVRKTLSRMRGAENELGSDVFRHVRYEDLIAEPENQLRGLCAFLGVEFDESMLRFYEREDSGYLSSEESWKKLTKSPLDPSRIGRYKDRMPIRDVRTVERELGVELSSYGYERAEGEPDRLAWRVGDGLQSAQRWLRRQRRSVKKRVT